MNIINFIWHFPHYHGSLWKPGSSIRSGDWKLVFHYESNHAELFNLKESELPWLNTNTDKEWDDFMRKSRLAFYRIYFELVQKERVLH